MIVNFNSRVPHTNEVNSLVGFVEIVLKYFPNDRWIFRGQDNNLDPLLPKAGRPEYRLPNSTFPKDSDLTRFRQWTHQAVAFEPDLPINPFERLAVAQHNGLATRLLDWTANAAVALYFATEFRSSEYDGGVFIFRKPEAINLREHTLKNCDKVMFYKPRPVIRRIIAQDGVFTFHPNPNQRLVPEPFTPGGRKRLVGNLVLLRVLAGKKRILQEELRAIGIHASSVFPDIEGLSRSINCVTHWMAHPRK